MPTITADDLQNLAYCARQCMPNLKTAEMLLVATAIQHAEADIAEMRKPAVDNVTMPQPEVAAPDATPAPTAGG